MVKKLLVLIIFSTLFGCATILTRPMEWPPLSDFTPPLLREIFSQDPVKVIAGKEVPFDGFLLTGPDFQQWKKRDQRLIDEIADLKLQGITDRDYATRLHLAVSSALKQCRKNQPQVFAAGVGAGAGGCAVIDRLADELTE